MHAGDPRADPAVIDLIELAGLWLGAGDWPALGRTLRRLETELATRFPDHPDFAARFDEVARLADRSAPTPAEVEVIRRTYRRATLG